jgi:hypothetical protein
MQTPRLTTDKNPTEPRMAPTKVSISCFLESLLSARDVAAVVDSEVRIAEADDIMEVNVGKVSGYEVSYEVID